MKGYYTHGNYYGYIPSEDGYMRFETIDAYKEYYREVEGEC